MRSFPRYAVRKLRSVDVKCLMDSIWINLKWKGLYELVTEIKHVGGHTDIVGAFLKAKILAMKTVLEKVVIALGEIAPKLRACVIPNQK